MRKRTLLSEILPVFYEELHGLLMRNGRSDLADQLPNLEVVGRCGCGQADCGTVHVKGGRTLNVVEENVIGVKHGGTINLEADKGYVIVDLDNFGRWMTIEAICREDVHQELEAGVKKFRLTESLGSKQQT
jgi:hypothetical protein